MKWLAAEVQSNSETKWPHVKWVILHTSISDGLRLTTKIKVPRKSDKTWNFLFTRKPDEKELHLSEHICQNTHINCSEIFLWLLQENVLRWVQNTWGNNDAKPSIILPGWMSGWCSAVIEVFWIAMPFPWQFWMVSKLLCHY